jgi:hypothetical protein
MYLFVPYGVNKEHSFGIVTNLKQCVSLKQEVPGNIRAQISGCFWASERFGYQLCPCICLGGARERAPGGARLARQ